MARKSHNKVFTAHLGFYDTVVAAPSQKAALEAWGSRQNLFQLKLAGRAEDPTAVKAALARPGVVLKRVAGTADPFSENPGLPKVSGPRPKKVKEQKKRSADARAVRAAEKTLAELAKGERDSLAGLEKERRATEEAFRARRRKAEEALARARRHGG